jgi:GNAT superfamily N-acetyltransferase
MPIAFEIADLRQHPEFFDAAADRIWQAWWKPHGYSLEHLRNRLRENLELEPIPAALIAHWDGRFLGTASVIESDLPERPQYAPWVAAVWVEPAARRHGIATALVEHAVQYCFALEIDRAYLCARTERTAFYQGLGWRIIERDVGTVPLNVFVRDAGPSAVRRHEDR